MSSKHWLATIGLLGTTGAVLCLLSSCATVTRTVVAPLEIEGATYLGDKGCVDCHARITDGFPGSPHARVQVAPAGLGDVTGCESCHGPGSRHVATGGQGANRFIINPRKEPQACFRCHLNVHAEFRLPNRHPVLEGQMSCAQCHDPHGHDIMKPAGGLAMARLNESCAQCHRDQARPFVYEHEAMREGCTVCHQVHGSANAKLLVQRDVNLCLKCHAQVQAAPGALVIGKMDHAALASQGSCWSAGCHTAVHGSNINPKLQY